LRLVIGFILITETNQSEITMNIKLSTKYFLPLAVALGLGWCLTLSGQAATLSGQIGMMGKATLDGPLATATSIISVTNARVGYGTGDYAVPGTIPVNTPVLLTPALFTGSPAVPMTLWEFTSGGQVYAFELHAWTHDCFSFAGNTFMNISGWGYASIDGVRQTLAEFCFSTQQCTDSTENTVTWSAETIVPKVPEGGTSITLLFFGIIGIELLRRRVHNNSKALVGVR
jgi:hypothetical protein